MNSWHLLENRIVIGAGTFDFTKEGEDLGAWRYSLFYSLAKVEYVSVDADRLYGDSIVINTLFIAGAILFRMRRASI
jgi:hypothetical protein